MKFKREDILARLRTNIEAGKPIIGAGAGTGISAKCEEAGGVDLFIDGWDPPHRGRGGVLRPGPPGVDWPVSVLVLVGS